MADHVTARLLAHTTSGIPNPTTLAVLGLLIGAAAGLIVNANRRMDRIVAANEAASPRPTPSPTARTRLGRAAAHPATFTLSSAAAGLALGYLAGSLLSLGLSSVLAPNEVIEQLCVAGTESNPSSSYLMLDDDVQHTLDELDATAAQRPDRAAAVVRSAIALGTVEPELVTRLATELADATDVDTPPECQG